MSRSKRLLVVAVIVFVVVLGAVYWFFDPIEVGWMPRCLWKTATGTDCPGCGSQRMAHALMHGDLVGAWKANAYALCMLPVIGFMLWLEFSRASHPRLYSRLHAPVVIWLLALSVVAWWILRNF